MTTTYMESDIYIDAFELIRNFLTREGYLFQENVNIDINLPNLINDTEIRPIDDVHVNFLIDKMKREHNNINNLLNHTPIIGFSPPNFRQDIRISDGNHRLVAARLFNASQSEHPIFLFPISFYVQSNLPLEHKLILMSMAEEKVYQNRKAFNKWEIMSHTRFLLLKCPSALGLEPLRKNAFTYEQKEFSKKVVEAVTKFFHVSHPSLVLSNIWKVTRISDEDFATMLIAFPNLPSGFNVHDFDVLFNKYSLSPDSITLLIEATDCCCFYEKHLNEKNHTCLKSLHSIRSCLRNIKPEFIPSLKHYDSYNPNWSEDDHHEFIVGEEYFATHSYTKTTKILQKYLAAKKRYLSGYDGYENKLNYLQRNFQDWHKKMQSTKKASKKSEKVGTVDASADIANPPEITNQQSEGIQSQNVVTNFINELVQNKMESLAAFAVHYILRPQNPNMPLPEFYFKYLKYDKFDFTKVPKDDGINNYEKIVNLDKYNHHTFFEEANENDKVAARKRKRKSVIENDSSKTARRDNF